MDRDHPFAIPLAPTRRALVLLAAGLVIAVLPAVLSVRLWPLWLLATGGTLCALAVDAALAPRRSDLEADLTAPGVLAMGDEGEVLVDFSVATSAAWQVGGSVRRGAATLDVDGPVESVSRCPVELAAGASGGRDRLRGPAAFRLIPRRRGAVRIARVWLRVPGPLGLMERTATFPGERTVEIHPNIARVRRAALRFADRRTFLSGLKIERFVGDGTEFEALREFAPGYDSRSIDWKATARHRRLLCREFRAERDHQVVVAFDTGRLMAEPVGAGLQSIPRLDHAIHTGLLLSYVALRSGDRVGLYAFDERPRMFAAPQAGARWFPGFLRLTAGLDYTEAETNFTLGLTELAGRLNRRSLVVVLTDFVDSITAELMAENLTRLARRHLVMFVAVRDPLLDELTAARPGSMIDVQRAVVAAGLERDRSRVQARLRRAGVFAVDLPPSRVEPQVLQRYLDIKRKEMIA